MVSEAWACSHSFIVLIPCIENQRPDAREHITIHCERIPGYSNLVNLLTMQKGFHMWTLGPKTGQEVTIEDLCEFGILSLISPYKEVWKGSDWVPFTDLTDGAAGVCFPISFEYVS